MANNNNNKLVSTFTLSLSGLVANWASTKVTSVVFASGGTVDTSVQTSGTGTQDDVLAWMNSIVDAVGQAASACFGSQVTYKKEYSAASVTGPNWEAIASITLETTVPSFGTYQDGYVPCALAIRGTNFNGVEPLSGAAQTNLNTSYGLIARGGYEAQTNPWPNTSAAQTLYNGIGGSWESPNS